MSKETCRENLLDVRDACEGRDIREMEMRESHRRRQQAIGGFLRQKGEEGKRKETIAKVIDT